MKAFLGTFMHTPAPDRLEVLDNKVILVGDDGRIADIRPAAEAEQYRTAGMLTELKPGQYLLPGLVDLHVHAPQFPQMGKALDVPLEVWLQKYTFPLEARYADLEFAGEAYESLVDTLLANGTTTTLYFTTIHLPATKLLADICLRRGQRALIGRVAMDNPGECPDYYRDASPDAAEADTRAFIDYVRNLPGNIDGLIQPVITPRYIPSCTDETLQRLAALVEETGCHVQTHCSESDWTHAAVLERCGVTDTKALDGLGFLTRRTVLAHGNFIGDDDLALIRERGSGIAHCPLSNIYLSDAALPLRRVLDAQVHVGLGTDIAGGASPSIFENARQAVNMARMLEHGVDTQRPAAERGRPGSRIDPVAALWLATAGGGEVLDLPIGLFKEGYQFDAILVDPGNPASNLQIYADDTHADMLQKIIYNAGRANVAKAWVGGKLVHEQRA
jgi:guanine deaminase